MASLAQVIEGTLSPNPDARKAGKFSLIIKTTHTKIDFYAILRLMLIVCRTYSGGSLDPSIKAPRTSYASSSIDC